MGDVAERASIKIVKEFQYRGSTREFSNRYHFTGDNIASQVDADNFAAQIADSEKHIHHPGITITRYEYTDAGSTHTTFAGSLDVVGTASTSVGSIAPGDSAALVRYETAARTSRNHPVYLFNYYHGPLVAPASDPDELVGTYKTALENYADAWTSGEFTSGTERFRCGPNGATAISRFVEDSVTHRDLPRRS